MTGLIRGASDSIEELVEVYASVLVCVKIFEENASLTFGDRAPKVFQAPVEFLLVDKSITVLVKDLEGAAKTANSVWCTEKFVSDSVDN